MWWWICLGGSCFVVGQCPPVPEALDAAHYREKLGTLGDGGLVSSPAEWSVMQGKMLRLDGDVDGYRSIRGNLGSCRGILKRKSCGITARSSSLQNGVSRYLVLMGSQEESCFLLAVCLKRIKEIPCHYGIVSLYGFVVLKNQKAAWPMVDLWSMWTGSSQGRSWFFIVKVQFTVAEILVFLLGLLETAEVPIWSCGKGCSRVELS